MAKVENANRKLTELNHLEARQYFLKSENYCNIDLPVYFNFQNLLENISTFLSGKQLSDYFNGKPEIHEDVNYKLFTNKDGEYSWRLFQLINPVLYVNLVHELTTEHNWEIILARFQMFNECSPKISCSSIPIQNKNPKKSGKATQIITWKQKTEQESIKLSVKYKYIFHTDIVDCYGSIYTHSIAWAIHDKEIAKQKRKDKKYLGNIIDYNLQQMSNGQTNGIPQGSTLMDFIAEIVLGYSDTRLLEKTKDISDFEIIRYRDDYRIFVNNPEDGKSIIRMLSEVLTELGMRINPEKTKFSNDVITSSIKADKLYWINMPKSFNSLQSELLSIRNLANKFPNSGTVLNCLVKIHKKLNGVRNIDVMAIIAIVTDIAYKNPRTYNISVAIISKLLPSVKPTQRVKLIEQILYKFNDLPNTELLHIWLQRIVISSQNKDQYNDIEFQGSLCKYVASDVPICIWNYDWINNLDFKKAINTSIIQKLVLDAVINNNEVNIFADY